MANFTGAHEAQFLHSLHICEEGAGLFAGAAVRTRVKGDFPAHFCQVHVRGQIPKPGVEGVFNGEANALYMTKAAEFGKLNVDAIS